MTKWLYLAGAISSEVAATLALRAMLDHPAWIVLVLTGYPVSFVFLAALLRCGVPVGVAYGIWSACGVAITAVAGAFLFHDPLTWLMGLGFACIVAGVLLVEWGSGAAEAAEAEPSHAGGAS